MTIDLRSDTVTRPTKPMLEAMMRAKLGDDVFGDDPTVIALEAKAAAMFSMEAGIFCPSGTMTNQIAIRIWASRGDEVICDRTAHIYNYEGGGIAANAGASVRLLSGDRGRFTAEDVLANINPDDPHYPITRLVSIENTANRGGGSCYTLESMKEISAVCRQHGLNVHLDGARIFNALVSLAAEQGPALRHGEQPAPRHPEPALRHPEQPALRHPELVSPHPEQPAPRHPELVSGSLLQEQIHHDPTTLHGLFDSISICLSKGLGAPVGSLLLGSTDFIHKARRMRKLMGGGMRQAGILAAAGIYALDHHIARLAEDHRRAKIIEATLRELAFVKDVLPVETNIVIFQLNGDATAKSFIEKLAQQDIKAVPVGPQSVRFVTHLDFDDEMLGRLLQVLQQLG